MVRGSTGFTVSQLRLECQRVLASTGLCSDWGHSGSGVSGLSSKLVFQNSQRAGYSLLRGQRTGLWPRVPLRKAKNRVGLCEVIRKCGHYPHAPTPLQCDFAATPVKR